MITQRDLDMIADAKAFAPRPPAPVPTWERVVEGLCWVLLAAITVGTTYLLWRI
jgi:hypothetical protein